MMKTTLGATFKLLLIGPIVLLTVGYAQDQSTAAIVHDKDPSVERIIENSKQERSYSSEDEKRSKYDEENQSKERKPSSTQEEMKQFRHIERPLYDRRYK